MSRTPRVEGRGEVAPEAAAPTEPRQPPALQPLAPPPLELTDLGHRFPGAQAPVLRGVSLAVRPGELLAVLGASGSGKTTLLRSVAGLVTPSEGEVRIAGERCAAAGTESVPAERRRVGLVFQDYALFPHLSVRDNIAFGLPRAERAGRLAELLAVQGFGELAPLCERRPGELSGGQQQRVALARALAPRPRLLLLDEPFANLDARLRQELGAELRRVLGDLGCAALLVTHDRAEALALADRVAVLGAPDGDAAGISTLLQLDPPECVYRQPKTRRVASMSGPALFVDGRCRGDVADTDLGPLPLREPAEGRHTIAIRPEQLRFIEDPAGRARVEARRFHGAYYAVDLDTPAGRLVAAVPADAAPPLGAVGRVGLASPAWALPG